MKTFWVVVVVCIAELAVWRLARRSQETYTSISLLPEDPYDGGLSEQHRAIVDALDKPDNMFFDLYGDGQQLYKLMADYVRAHPD